MESCLRAGPLGIRDEPEQEKQNGNPRWKTRFWKKDKANAVIDKGVFTLHRNVTEDVKTSQGTYRQKKESVVSKKESVCSKKESVCSIKEGFSSNNEKDCDEKKTWWDVSGAKVVHYVTLVLLGFLTWGLIWCTWGDSWRWGGEWFKLIMFPALGWALGQILQEVTGLPPLLAALMTGILARNLGFLDMRQHMHVDGILRKIYPAIILGKGSLGWNTGYMREHWRQIITLGPLPWAAEVITLATCTHFFLGFPWLWGFLLGSIYASVSCPVIMPSVVKYSSLSSTRNWIQLICTAGGFDTGLSVGVYGLLFTFMFHDACDLYRYTKAILAIFVGIGVGVTWGSIAKFVPHSKDAYVAELRILFVVIGGLLIFSITMYLGWGGTGGVAVLACNATAAMHWANDGWKLNNNPASTAYRVMWATLEPILFTYTGTFFVIKPEMWNTMLIGLGVLAICVAVRLGVAALVSWDLRLKEKLFYCCCWSPKSIVEAVLCPMALHTVLSHDHTARDMELAEQFMELTVQAIIITTPIGFLLTHHLGPILLKEKEKEIESDITPHKRKSIHGVTSDEEKA